MDSDPKHPYSVNKRQALTGTAGGNKKVLVTYPEALFEKVVLPKTLSANIIHIRTGDTIDPGQLLLQLGDYGFERTDFVYEPGQFAIRGGILDIYSFGNEKPYRVELYGNEVDSIRIVDPETQLSERKLLQVSIIPNVDTQFEDEGRISLFDFLPENTIFWIQDYALCREHIADSIEDLESFLRIQEELKAQFLDSLKQLFPLVKLSVFSTLEEISQTLILLYNGVFRFSKNFDQCFFI